MINTKFMDNYFKFLFLSFWPIIWYELIFVSDPFIKSILVALYCIATLIYIPLIIFFNDNNIKSITLYYRISTLTAFIFTLFSLLLFPTSLFFLTLKVIFVFIYLYLSYIKFLGNIRHIFFFLILFILKDTINKLKELLLWKKRF